MRTQAIWWVGIFLDGLILFRSCRWKMRSEYPFFYSYVVATFLTSGLLFLVYRFLPSAYQYLYWTTDFVTLVVGCGVMLEIVKHALDPYAGAERFGRWAVVTVFAATFAYVCLREVIVPGWSPAASTVELERDLRVVQALILFALLFVIFHYRIALGRNVKGMVVGYGIYVAASLMSLALRSYSGSILDAAWKTIQPFSYDAAVAIWVIALWSYSPNPIPNAAALANDYESLVSRTRGMLGAMRSILEKGVRP